MAICVMAVVGAAPCQCFSPGGNQTTSPGWISSIGPPHRCAQPQPEVTIRVWPSGWVCQAVRAPGSKVTSAPRPRAGVGASNKGSTRTLPVNYLLATIELPIVSHVIEASPERPYLSLRLELDPTPVGSVMVEAGHISTRSHAVKGGME
jgi:hypothetical protein